MAKRKFGASIIILCIAAITLISGTYAWFLVGGFADLFDIGFDVIEAGGGILLRGDAGTYGGGKTDNGGWGDKLERSDFTALSFISQGGKYKPISSNNGTSFIGVTMDGEKFICNGVVPTKTSAGVTETDICYNNFTFSIKSVGDELPAGAYVKIKLNGDSFNESNEVVQNEDAGASTAARASVTVDGTTTIYSTDGQNYNAVTATFADDTITDSNENYIIDSADPGNGAAGLSAVTSPALVNSDSTEVKIPLGIIPANSTNGKEVSIRIWLEGNDPECIAFGDGAVAGKSLMSYISFGVDE
ncbi:MAG: hypothetical protein IJT41_13350 [Clostridia bacterium]|nr:hypothetical protein [Clostridia bacterium]